MNRKIARTKKSLLDKVLNRTTVVYFDKLIEENKISITRYFNKFRVQSAMANDRYPGVYLIFLTVKDKHLAEVAHAIDKVTDELYVIKGKEVDEMYAFIDAQMDCG